jgi:hypothetical protein
LKNSAHISILKPKRKLNSQKTNAHIYYLQKSSIRLCTIRSSFKRKSGSRHGNQTLSEELWKIGSLCVQHTS